MAEATQKVRVNGATYYREGRKCNACGCRDIPGLYHWGYWYVVKHGMRNRVYVGTQLPLEVVRAVSCREAFGPEMSERRDELREKIAGMQAALEALECLQRGDYMSERDRWLIHEWFPQFEEVLVDEDAELGIRDRPAA